jgi:CRP/FNR family transcriptional regulator, cyclic AMP receptor protein
MGRKSYLWNSFFKKKDRTVYQALKSLSLFNGLRRRQLKEIERIGHVRSFNKDEVIFYREEPSYGFYILLEGEVAITVGDVLITTFRPIDLFGQFSLVDGNKRTATATAKKDTTLFYIYAHHMKQLFKVDPSLGFIFYEQLFSMLSSLIERYDENLCSEKCSEKSSVKKNGKIRKK